MSTFASRSQACASVRPIAPTSGSEKTAVGTVVWSTAVGLPPNPGSGKGWASGVGAGRRVDAVGHIADRMDVRHGGLRRGMDGDATIGGEAHARRIETEVGDIRPAPEREHHFVDFNRAVVG